MNPDDLVWHYTDGPGLLSIVSHHVLWATASGFLNDAEEVDLGIRLVREAVQRRAGAGDDFARTVLDRLPAESDTFRTPSPTLFFILSAAQHWDLLAMWRCYGGRGESYALGLDPAGPLAALADPGADVSVADLDAQLTPEAPPPGRHLFHRSWSPVHYDLDEQRALADAVLDGMPEELAALRVHVEAERSVRGTQVREHLRETLDDAEQAIFLIKHHGFHDERETRHSTGLLDATPGPIWPGVVRYRSTPWGIAPYLWLTAGDGAPVTTRAAPLPIRALAISPSPNGTRATESAGAMMRAHGYDVPVLRSTIPFRG